MLGLHCCTWAFSFLESGSYSSYTAWASHCGCFSSWGAWAPGHVGSVLVAHRLSSSTACGSFLDQGWNPYPLHWQSDSSPLSYQGSPSDPFSFFFFSSCFLFILSLLCICFSVHMSLASCLIIYYSVNTNNMLTSNWLFKEEVWCSLVWLHLPTGLSNSII